MKGLYFVVVSVKKALFRRVAFISFAHVVLVFCFLPLKRIRLSVRKLGFKKTNAMRRALVVYNFD